MNHVGTLYHYELKKLLHRKIVWVTILLSLLIVAFSISLDLIGSYYIDGEKIDTNYHMYQTDRQYQEALNGRVIDQSLMEETINAYRTIPDTPGKHYTSTREYQKNARPYSAIFNFICNSIHMTISETRLWTPDITDFLVKRQEMLNETWKDSGLSESEMKFWLNKETEVEKPFTFQLTNGFFSLFKAITTIGILMLISMSVCLSNTFAEEHTRKTDQLILCSTHGKSTAYLAKILAGISFAVGYSFIITLFAFTLSFSLYGTDGFHAAIQLLFSDYSYPLTVGHAILIIYILLMITAVLVSIFVMFLSELIHNSIAALALNTALIIFSMICQIPPQYRILSQIWNWLPSTFLTPWNIFDVRLLSVFDRHFTAWQAVPVIYILLSILIAKIGKTVYQHYQVTGR